MELKATIVLSESGSKDLKTGFVWKSVRRADIPSALRAMLPPGDVIVSPKLNKSFSGNPTYAHGLVIALANESWNRVYVLATDRDHPVQ